MTWTYQAITLVIILLIGWNLWREKRFAVQIAAVLVLIPLVLRLLMIK